MALTVDHVEVVTTQLPMVSRILHLLAIDILTVGVAMRLGDESLAALPQDTAAGLDETRPDPAPALAPTWRKVPGWVSARRGRWRA